MKSPIEADFEVRAEGAEIVVVFKPTKSEFRYMRRQVTGTSAPLVRHPRGDTGQYIEAEVCQMADGIAARHALSRDR